MELDGKGRDGAVVALVQPERGVRSPLAMQVEAVVGKLTCGQLLAKAPREKAARLARGPKSNRSTLDDRHAGPTLGELESAVRVGGVQLRAET